ncbi:hypothetical protein ANO11243_034750 [Dothideomycetidae sp. 11243]|nr:hypothetical protein ANO11243_034750 [fungal sp. No.11243]
MAGLPLENLLHRRWLRDGFMISTDSSLISVTEVNAAFASDTVYWTKPLPEEVLRATIRNSLCFGLYRLDEGSEPATIRPDKMSRHPLIGFARCITDFNTFVYLTDVYVLPTYQSRGLGRWLISCVQEVILAMPHLRRSMLLTGDWKRSVPFYREIMDMEIHGTEQTEGVTNGSKLAVLMRKGPGHI